MEPSPVVLPQPLEYTERGGGKSVQELQHLIEEALTLLAKKPSSGRAGADLVAQARAFDVEVPQLGAATGSEIRHKVSLTSRLVKTVLGLAAALLFMVVPLKNVLTATSTEAYVNAPLLLVRAPAAGTFVSDNPIGARVAKHDTLGFIALIDGGESVPIVALGSGKIWDVLVPSGSDVAAGQEIAHIAACTTASVVATVSETIYDRLAPGMAARFNFYGSDRFYLGTVANLLGRSASVPNLAISPGTLEGGAYRVIVSVPDLGAIPNCAIGKRGEIVFDTARG